MHTPSSMSSEPDTMAAFHKQGACHVTSKVLAGPQGRACQLRPGLEAVRDRLAQLLSSTIHNGDNCSLLVVGAPGVGKTLAIEQALQGVLATANKDPNNPAVGVVRLCGALHDDERTAFLEVARQLCMCFRIPFTRTASCDDNMAFLAQVLRELHRAFKAVVFIIDGLEAYVRASKQTLLYNLLDALSSSQVRAAVLGVTSFWDIQEAMEKRVRSRFSQAKLMVPGLDPHSEEDSLLAVLHSMLQLPTSWQPQQRMRQYNGWVASALQDKAVQEALCCLQHQEATPRELCQLATATMASWLSSASPSGQLLPAHLLAALQALASSWDTAVSAVQDCSKLELCLLVASCRLQEHGQPSFNFEMVWDEFSKQRQEQLGHMWRRGAAWRAFLDLVAVGLLRFHSARPEAHGHSQCYLPVQLAITRKQLQQGCNTHATCPDFIKRWLTGEQHTTMTLLA